MATEDNIDTPTGPANPQGPAGIDAPQPPGGPQRSDKPGAPSPSPGNPPSSTTSISQTVPDEAGAADENAETSQGQPSDASGSE